MLITKYRKIWFLVLVCSGLFVALNTSTEKSQRMPHQPTAADQLPDVLLGKAPAPRGVPLSYFDEDSKSKGYLAEPAGDGPHGAVILIHEWNGLNDRVRQVADALAG